MGREKDTRGHNVLTVNAWHVAGDKRGSGDRTIKNNPLGELMYLVKEYKRIVAHRTAAIVDRNNKKHEINIMPLKTSFYRRNGLGD